MADGKQAELFHAQREWEQQWSGMPEFSQADERQVATVTVQFRSMEDRRAFLSMLGENPERAKSIWYPRMSYLKQSITDAAPTTVRSNTYPIYVISKGRYALRLTGKALDKLGIDYRMVVEPQEAEQYAAVMDATKILVLPHGNLGLGSIPARNWVWEHALSRGATRHWILDDNIDGFYRFNSNRKTKVVDENPFAPIEAFVDRYTNVALAGMQYEFFVARRAPHYRPFVLNTRIYSCILIENVLPFRWRGRYNEDTDLSLRALKCGYCTALFNAYLCKKLPSMKLSGGNTDDLYQMDGRLQMAESLVAQHPDVVTVTEKWGRPQHLVDYSPFKKNKLIEKRDD